MTQEEKQLLLKDLCARLPYETKILCTVRGNNKKQTVVLFPYFVADLMHKKLTLCKPYLRPMSSMTDEEKLKFITLTHYNVDDCGKPYRELTVEALDWLNAHHFDYRGLIEKGLALEAPEGMYKTE